MSDVIITVENLGKKYRLGQRSNERYTALRDVITNSVSAPFRRLRNGRRSKIEDRSAKTEARATRDLRSPISQLPSTTTSSASEFWALKGVSFEVRRGEVVGIIGRNGAGKSTLLKILSRITEPTEGRVRIRGRVASLLEVGTGFHPELTGRENIYLNGAILGMTRAEIQKKFDEIVDFAEIEKFLETPVKRYSSGMYVRLAFAVAAHLEPEILVVDEVLAVGDAEFQKKCLGKMGEISRGGRTVLFVSHNMSAVMNLCGRAILLSTGALRSDGAADKVVNEYLAIQEKTAGFQPRSGQRTGDHQIRIEDFRVEPENPATGTPVKFIFKLSRNAGDGHGLEVELAVSILTEHGVGVLQIFSNDMNRTFRFENGTFEIEVSVEQLPLMPGNYTLNLWAGSGTTPFDWIRGGFFLTVIPGGYVDGRYVDNRGYPVVIPSFWALK